MTYECSCTETRNTADVSRRGYGTISAKDSSLLMRRLERSLTNNTKLPAIVPISAAAARPSRITCTQSNCNVPISERTRERDSCASLDPPILRGLQVKIPCHRAPGGCEVEPSGKEAEYTVSLFNTVRKSPAPRFRTFGCGEGESIRFQRRASIHQNYR